MQNCTPKDFGVTVLEAPYNTLKVLALRYIIWRLPAPCDVETLGYSVCVDVNAPSAITSILAELYVTTAP